MEKPGAKARLQYWFDNWMASGTIALMGLLGLATAAMVVVIGTLAFLVHAYPGDSDHADLVDLWWGALMRTLDPGTMGGDTGWGFRLLMLLITIGGLIIVASLIGIISGAFDDKIAELRRGHSPVLENDHTLILGWSDKVPLIVKELALANESRGRACVVIVANRDKVDMDQMIKVECPDLHATKVITRSADPTSVYGIRLGSPQWARSIIVLAPEDALDPDIDVIKAVLAVTNSATPPREDGQFVAELSRLENWDITPMVGSGKVQWVLAPEVIGRIMVQSSRQSGLSLVYEELLDFEGNEIYFFPAASLVGMTYFEVQQAGRSCVAIGVVRGDEVLVNPSDDVVIIDGDQIVVIAPDDDQIFFGDRPAHVDTAAIIAGQTNHIRSDRTAILGAGPTLPLLLRALDAYSSPASLACVVAPDEPEDLPALTNLRLKLVDGDPTQRAVLDAIGLERYDHTLLLADVVDIDANQADNRTLVTLLHLRDIARSAGKEPNIVSEMRVESNRELAEVAQPDDLIVSSRLIALILAQLSENQGLAGVFGVLFGPEGSEIYLRPAGWYLRLGEPVNFYTILEAARRRGETAIGYRIGEHAHNSHEAYGVRLNPEKSELVTFGPEDRLIVLAEG